MSTLSPDRVVLIVEDGDEYRENLTRFVPGPTYVQARSGAKAVSILQSQPVDLVYLDMRFDRIPREDLLGDHAVATRQNNGDPLRGWRYLQNNQGLFVLNALSAAGFANHAVILAYDFSRETNRWGHLKRRYPRLEWVPDAITPEEIRALMLQCFESNQTL
jgi:CheY-like chemotaxis protein